MPVTIGDVSNRTYADTAAAGPVLAAVRALVASTFPGTRTAINSLLDSVTLCTFEPTEQLPSFPSFPIYALQSPPLLRLRVETSCFFFFYVSQI